MPGGPPKPTPPKPTDAELEILTVLWSRGPSTVRDVHETIIKRRPAQYTTMLKLMQITAEKGLVQRDEAQRAHIYRATKPREWTQRQLAGELLPREFNGSARSLMMGALSARKVSKQELAELRQLLEEHKRGRDEFAARGCTGAGVLCCARPSGTCALRCRVGQAGEARRAAEQAAD